MSPLDISLPFKPRNPMPINSAFGKRPLYNDFHSGCDFNASTNAPSGARVPAAGSGVVVESYNGNVKGQSNWARLRGTMVAIDHGTDRNGDHWLTRYHMLVPNSNAAKGTRVAAGDTIGRVGNSGSSGTGAHCHFELWKNGVAVNPLAHLEYTGTPSASTATKFDNTIEEKVEDMAAGVLFRHPQGGIAFAPDDGDFIPLSTMDEVNALVASGAARDVPGDNPWIQLGDGLIWNIRTRLAIRKRAQGNDTASLAASLAPLLIPAITAALPASAGLTKEQVQEVTEKAVRSVFADAAS